MLGPLRLKKPGAAAALVCALAGLVYANSLTNGFALDDTSIVLENEEVHGLEAIPEAVRGPYWPTGSTARGMYRPLTLATFAVDWDIWNGSPFGFHLSNVALHVAVTGLLFALLFTLGSGVAGATAGAAVFAVHPVHVEAVANVVGRAEVLAALFFLIACVVYARWRSVWGRTAVITLLYLLALLSKEIGVTLPGALVLIELVRHGSIRAGLAAAGRSYPVYLGLAFALGAYLVLRWVNIGAVLGGEAPWLWGAPEGTRFWTAIRVLPEYLRLMIFPAELVPDYGPAVIVPESRWWAPLVLSGIFTAAVAALVVVITWRRHRLVAAGFLWFAGTVLPVSGLLFPVGVMVAERTLYLPSVGLALLVAGVAVAVRQRSGTRHRQLAAAALALVVLAAGARTWVQNPVWADTESVMHNLLSEHPENFRAQWVVGLDLLARGEAEAGLERLAFAIRMVPGYYRLRMEYGLKLHERGRYAEAAEQFQAAREMVPELVASHVYYLQSLLLDGRPEAVTAAAPAVLDRFPESLLTRHLQAQALARSGRIREAKQARLAAARLDTGDARWLHWVNLAALELADQRPGAAAAALDSARAAAPDPQAVPGPDRLARWLAEGRTDPIPFW